MFVDQHYKPITNKQKCFYKYRIQNVNCKIDFMINKQLQISI